MSSENRENERYTALFQVTVKNITIPSTNISLGGMQLICDRITCNMLKRQVKDDIADISIPLSKDSRIDITCNVSYISPYDDKEFLIGLEFVEYVGDGKAILEAYINENAGRSLKLIE